MREAPVARDCDVADGAPASALSASGSTESDLDYYGWRVVLAACFGVMAGFGSLFSLYLLRFCEATRR